MDHSGHTTAASHDHGSEHGSGHESGHSHSMMMMYFHVGTSETVLFDFWTVTDVGSLLWSCVIVFLIAFLYEGLKYIRDTLHQKAASTYHSKGSPANSTVELAKNGTARQSCSAAVFAPTHLMQTVLHGLQFFISYLLMLVFMTYNVWLCLAVILGATFGFFLFGWRKQSAVDSTEHCQ